jgi:hypothetical protein
MRLIFDFEANNLLNSETVDYASAPFRLKPTFSVWCLAIRDVDTNASYLFEGEDVKNGVKMLVEEATEIIGHNIIDFDLLLMKAMYGVDYYFPHTPRDKKAKYNGTPIVLGGREKLCHDTLVMSKCANPDRWGGHSLEAWGKRIGLEKIDWRGRAIELGLISASAPKGAEFAQYHPEMGEYCARDTEVNRQVFLALYQELGEWPWTDAMDLEHWVRDIVTRQSHRGFLFNQSLAASNIQWLDAEMERIRAIVEPMIPPKLMGVTEQKRYIPPAQQFLKNGTPSSFIRKFVERHEGELWEENGEWHWKACGKSGILPIPNEPLKTHAPASVSDITHIKGWLVSLGWRPTQYKERDLTCDAKKNKLSQEKFEAAVERYVAQTLASPFCNDRLDELDTTRTKLRERLLKHKIGRPLKVLTNPCITVGMDKELDGALDTLGAAFPHARLVADYLTYSHRRNSILGGGVDFDDEDDTDPEDREWNVKGFLSSVRNDGRIATPADSCGAGTSRFKHRLVANIPRVTSKFGSNMRAMFGVGEGKVQWGYDFDSLEARIEGHYVHPYPGGPEYAETLVALKPNDCHTLLATKISQLIGKAFPRGSAKNVKYGCSYGAQIPRTAKTIGCDLDTASIVWHAFWEQAAPLKALKERMEAYWETTGQKKFLRGIDGRKLPIRSKANLINSAFQSAGVICAKRAMVLHEDAIIANGMGVDFWTQNWKNKKFAQQLIAYHDEAQGEVSRELVKMKVVRINTWLSPEGKDSPEVVAAKAKLEEWKAARLAVGEVWSDIGKTDNAMYTGYCLAGQLATEAVRLAGEYYNLNVPLSAGYMLGANWAQCH